MAVAAAPKVAAPTTADASPSGGLGPPTPLSPTAAASSAAPAAPVERKEAGSRQVEAATRLQSQHRGNTARNSALELVRKQWLAYYTQREVGDWAAASALAVTRAERQAIDEARRARDMEWAGTRHAARQDQTASAFVHAHQPERSPAAGTPVGTPAVGESRADQSDVEGKPRSFTDRSKVESKSRSHAASRSDIGGGPRSLAPRRRPIAISARASSARCAGSVERVLRASAAPQLCEAMQVALSQAMWRLSTALGGLSSAVRHGAETRAALAVQSIFRGNAARLEHGMRRSLQAVPRAAAFEAAAGGLDAMISLISLTLGTQIWARAVYNAPADWEEADMVAAVSELLCEPAMSAHVWLLCRPTTYELALLKALRTVRLRS